MWSGTTTEYVSNVLQIETPLGFLRHASEGDRLSTVHDGLPTTYARRVVADIMQAGIFIDRASVEIVLFVFRTS